MFKITMNQFYQNQKLLKLKYLLQNSKLKTMPTEILNSFSHSHSVFSNFQQDKKKKLLLNTSSSQKQTSGITMSKDLSLFLSLVEKPLNLLFSMDQFVFEFSKKTYQQKKAGEFFQQLKERKKLSLFYGNLTRKQLFNLFNKVNKNKGYFSKNVFSLLERRLDVVLYRSGFTKTIAEARQLIKHKKTLVNKKVINIPSFLVTPGDFISMTLKTGEILRNRLGNSVKQKTMKNSPKIVEDFYSKLKKTVDSSCFLDKKKEFEKFKKSPSGIQNYRSKEICRLLIQLLSTKTKSRSFYNFKKQGFYLNKITLESSPFLEKNDDSKNLNLFKTHGFPGKKSRTHKNSLTISKKSILTMFKWKSFSEKKQFFSKRSFDKSHEKNFYLSNLLKQKKSVYANQGCLQKKPLFWNTNLSNLRQKKNFFSKLEKKHLKFLPLKKKKFEVYRKSFFIFLKHLENYKKFTNLVTLSFNKFLVKKSFSKQKFNDTSRPVPNFQFGKKKNSFFCKPNFQFGNPIWEENLRQNLVGFSKNLNFRLLRPLNLEISYNLLNIVYLYSPQRVNFPFSIDLDLIQRSLR